MQNKYQQRHLQPQYFHHHRLNTHSTNPSTSTSTNPQNQMHHKDNEILTFPSSVITRCALQLTTRLNTLENRMDALETILLQERSETCPMDTLTARRLSGLKKRRRSKRIISAWMLDDINDGNHMQKGTTPRPFRSPHIRSNLGSRKSRNDLATYVQCQSTSFGEGESD